MAPMRVAVVCGGQSSEHEVSLNTGRMILKNLDRRKYRPTLIVIDKNGKWQFGSIKKNIGDAIKKLKDFDFVFIAIHGAFGEDGRFQTLLEKIKTPYSGSGVASSAKAIDKAASNALYEMNGIRVPRYAVIKKGEAISMKLPLVIKPSDGGSSVGISVVKFEKDLQAGLRKAFRESGHIMVQEYIEGREFTCGILEDEHGKPFALPPTEIVPKTSSFFDYQAKYKAGGSLEITPPNLPKAKIQKIQQLALKAHRLLSCRGMSRSDFI